MAWGADNLTEEEKRAMTLNKWQEKALIASMCKEFDITEEKFEELAKYPSWLYVLMYSSFFPLEEREIRVREWIRHLLTSS